MTRVSVVMPVHNKAPFLKESLGSILSQTWKDLEVVAVDDASTDDSLEVLRSFGDPRLRIIPCEVNLGPAGAAQRAMDEARGEYIVRMDADDVAFPDRIERQVAFMDGHPELAASGGQLPIMDKPGVVWRFPLSSDDCRAGLLFGTPVAQPTAIYRSQALRRHGVRFQSEWPRVGEDWLFWTRLSAQAPIANLDAPLTWYRVGEQNIAHGRDKAADYAVVLRQVFAMTGFPLTDQELDLHLMALKVFHHRPTAARVVALRAWLDRLVERNDGASLLPKEAFRRRVERSWDELYPFLPPLGAAPALAHLRCSGRWPADRLLYLLKCRVRATFGRSAAGGKR